MAEVKGKFIKLSASLMSLSNHKDALDFCDKVLFEKIGKHWFQLEDEGWYDTKIFNGFIVNFAKASPKGVEAIIEVGKRVFPTVKHSVGLPPTIETPLDLIVFEAEAYAKNHRVDHVLPRTFIKKEDGHVIVQAPAPGYHQKLYDGVFLGILEMFNVTTGNIKLLKGEPHYEYEITW
ncbi:MAG: hypothetical protein GY827_11190 [Cytophagales bacterium]|nr:hypothetical protein [Cytophagales bacterium]